MKKLTIAIAVLAAAIVSTGSFTRPADLPPPDCAPDCAISLPS